MTRPSLSLIVIAKNAGSSLRRCLDSVDFADEKIVLQSGSSDDTVAVAQSAGAQVSSTPDFPGFGPQKQRALAMASGEWVLSLDADEWIEPPLGAEILAALQNPGSFVAFEMPRFSSFCGRILRHGDWSRDRVLRLFRRAAGRYSDDQVHERILIEGAVGQLRQPLMHEAVIDLEQALQRMNFYSTLSARERHKRGQRASLPGALGHGFWTFFRSYVLGAGFLDGAPGFYQALSAGEGSFYRYAKLREMNRSRSQR